MQGRPSEPPDPKRLVDESPTTSISAHCGRPAVSVILPTFNRREYLAASVESVLGQTYRDFELIVIDDGSTDGTGEMVESRWPSIRYFPQANAGVAAARNRGLDEARGRLIAFADADDLWHHGKLARQVGLLADNAKIDVVCTAKRVIDHGGHVSGRQWKRLHAGRVTEALFGHVFVTMPSVVVRRELVDRVGRFDVGLRIHSDYEFWLRASLWTEFAAIDEPLVDVRRSSDSLTSTGGAEAAVLKLRMLKRFYNQRAARQAIRPAIARRRLGEVAFEAARLLSAAGEPGRATEMLDESLAHHPTLRARWARFWSGLGPARCPAHLPRV